MNYEERVRECLRAGHRTCPWRLAGTVRLLCVQCGRTFSEEELQSARDSITEAVAASASLEHYFGSASYSHATILVAPVTMP